MHRTYISDVEHGHRSPPLQSIERIALGLSVTVAALFTEAEDDTNSQAISFQKELIRELGEASAGM